MKKTILFAALLSSSLFSFASAPTSKPTTSETFHYSMYARTEAQKIYFAYENEGSSPLTVSIVDAKGVNVYEKSFTSEKSRISFDLAELGEGTYTVNLKAGEFESTENMTLNEEAGVFTARISSQVTDNKVRYSFTNAQKPVNLYITDAHGEEVHSQVLSKGTQTGYINFKIGKGKYEVALVQGKNTVKQDVVID